MNTNPVDTPLIHAGFEGALQGLGKKHRRDFHVRTMRLSGRWWWGGGGGGVVEGEVTVRGGRVEGVTVGAEQSCSYVC